MPDRLKRNGVAIDDSFAEAFDMRATGIIITAHDAKWARRAAGVMTGFATSVIACGAEAAIDREIAAADTPDGRPGVRVLLFATATAELQKQLANRVGQCVLTSPGSACYAGLDDTGEWLPLGDRLRYFGDGWQIAKRLHGRRYWRIPVMDGEFVVESRTALTKGAVGGGNLILLGRGAAATLRAAEAAVAAIAHIPDCITPFPGGIARSGSKLGAKYRGMVASTNHRYCPTLRGAGQTDLDPDTESVLEIVIDGLTPQAVADAMRAGMGAAIALGPKRGAARITAGNYGGKLGRHQFRLHELLR